MAGAEEAGPHPLSLLVVDDHEVVRTGLVAAFAAEPGIAVVGSAGDGGGALAEAARLRPDLALVDYRLPDMTGVELCRRLRALCPAPDVVMVSTYLSEEIVRGALAAGAAAFVTKAAGLGELKRELHAIAAGTERPTDAPRIVAR